MNERTSYWLDLCEYDLSAARSMLASKHYLYVGFMCHQTAEKALKACLCNLSDELPPKVHSLHKLVTLTGLKDELTPEQLGLLDRLNPLNIEARYPEHKERLAARLTAAVCEDLITQTEGFLLWIRNRLTK